MPFSMSFLSYAALSNAFIFHINMRDTEIEDDTLARILFLGFVMRLTSIDSCKVAGLRLAQPTFSKYQLTYLIQHL
jgi:hypothetical protein